MLLDDNNLQQKYWYDFYWNFISHSLLLSDHRLICFHHTQSRGTIRTNAAVLVQVVHFCWFIIFLSFAGTKAACEVLYTHIHTHIMKKNINQGKFQICGWFIREAVRARWGKLFNRDSFSMLSDNSVSFWVSGNQLPAQSLAIRRLYVLLQDVSSANIQTRTRNGCSGAKGS